jgi:protein phosphatase
MTDHLQFAANSHVGLVRENNEDSYAIVHPGQGYPLALVLADGMGGHSKGELASRIAVDFVASFLREDLLTPRQPGEWAVRLPELVKKANVKVYLGSLDQAENKGMGTTLTALVVSQRDVVVAHVGDCRVYMFRDGNLRQLTVDHTLVQEMVDAGSLTPDETRNHPRRNVLTRALGFPEFINPDVMRATLEAGDLLLLCSDGLHGFVSDEAIAASLSGSGEPQAAVDRLVQASLDAGGEDNVTVLVLQFDSPASAGGAQ